MGQQSAPLHASSEKHSAYYQCALLEMIHSARILSKATVASYSLGVPRRDGTHLIALQNMINVIGNPRYIILLLSRWLIGSQIALPSNKHIYLC